MDRLFTLNACNYDPALPELCRTAVRAIVFQKGRLLLIRSADGDIKLPGGGIEPGEDDAAALARETLEETGYAVIPSTVRPFGEVEEKRLSLYEDRIWHQYNHYYFCEVNPRQRACSYTESEKKLGFCPVWYTLEEAIDICGRAQQREGPQAWNQRELRLLQFLKTYLQ